MLKIDIEFCLFNVVNNIRGIKWVFGLWFFLVKLLGCVFVVLK